MKTLRITCAILVGLFCLLKLPSWHYKYIRNTVGYRTVEITNPGPELHAGGTGVHVQLPSGKVAIITNAHICELKDQRGMVRVYSPALERPIERKVIEQADFTDLCLVEPIPGVSGLSLGAKPEVGDIIAVIGHPLLQPLTMTRGEVVGEMDVQIFDHIIGFGAVADNGTCNNPKNEILTIPTFFGIVTICTVKVHATLTTVTILGGNSGSAAVNYRGQIIGIAFAADNRSNWGSLVGLEDIRKFIAPY